MLALHTEILASYRTLFGVTLVVITLCADSAVPLSHSIGATRHALRQYIRF
jgi:hypothetical protein